MVTIDDSNRTTITVEAGQAQQDLLQIKETIFSRKLEGQIGWARRVGDYFLVEKKLVNNGSKIEVLSMTGEVVGTLREAGITIDLLDAVREQCKGYNYVAGYGVTSGSFSSAGIARLHPNVQKLIVKLYPAMAGVREMNIHSFPEKMDVNLSDSYPTSEICGGKYLVDPNAENLFAVQVKNDNGALLPKDQWTVYSLGTIDRKIPDDLQRWVIEKNLARKLSRSPRLLTQLCLWKG